MQVTPRSDPSSTPVSIHVLGVLVWTLGPPRIPHTPPPSPLHLLQPHPSKRHHRPHGWLGRHPTRPGLQLRHQDLPAALKVSSASAPARSHDSPAWSRLCLFPKRPGSLFWTQPDSTLRGREVRRGPAAAPSEDLPSLPPAHPHSLACTFRLATGTTAPRPLVLCLEHLPQTALSSSWPPSPATKEGPSWTPRRLGIPALTDFPLQREEQSSPLCLTTTHLVGSQVRGLRK